MTNLSNLDQDIVSELKRVVEGIKSRISVKKVILFGSYAYGIPRHGSDIDLCVITDDKRRKIEILWDIQELLYKTAKHAFDILVCKPEEFAYRADSIATIEKTISSKGVVLYG